MNSDIKTYFQNLKNWKSELTELRTIILACGLDETIKWKHPCYTVNNTNILLIHGFKDYCAILFTKGALLKDAKNILVQQTENVQSARQLRFTDISEITKLHATIKNYIKEAVAVEASNKKVIKKKTSDFKTPEALENIFKERADFKTAFEKLSPGRQRGYLLHFNQPKQAKTKTSRILKNMERIIDGYGLHDCTCGLSKRKPNCDGSHKKLIEQ